MGCPNDANVARDLLRAAERLQAKLTGWRRQLHANPELGFQEHRTAELIERALREISIDFEVGIAGTGVVARLGEAGPAIGLRADMDALPIREANDVSYVSRVPDLMHACGHDAHVAMLLGAAHILTDLPSRPPGEIRLLFQPSEESIDQEGKGGAQRMIEAGAAHGLSGIIALHVDSEAPSGTVGIREGAVTAAVDPFQASIIGKGCHSAFPHQGVSPIAILAQVVGAVQSVPTLRVDPREPAVIAIESVHGGAGTGLIPDRVQITGNIRSTDQTVRKRLHLELERALEIAVLSGGDYELTIESYSPATRNHPVVAQTVGAAAREIVGTKALFEPLPRLYGEDFSYFAERVPGTLAFLGVRAGAQHRPLHTPIFDLDESALPVGAALLAVSAVRLLRDLQRAA